MTCSDETFTIEEINVVEGCTIKLKEFLTSGPYVYASINITYPWGITHSMSLLFEETKTIVNPDDSNEFVTINFKTYFIYGLAVFRVCYEKEAAPGFIICESTPSGAKVYYKENYDDSYQYMGVTDLLIEFVPPGIRYIKLTLNGYYDHEDSYLVYTDQITNVDVELEPIVTTGSLYCGSFPTGAKILLNGIDYGVTNKTITNLSPGTYNLKFELSGWETYEKIITIVVGEETWVYKDLVQLLGTLNCTSNPTGANIYLNEVSYGTTNRDITDLTPDSYDVKYTLSGYEDYIKENVIISAGQTTYVSKNMVPIPKINTSIIFDYYSKDIIVSEVTVNEELFVVGKLKNSDPIPNKTLKLYSNDHAAGDIDTDETGAFNVQLSTEFPGTFDNKIIFDGDDQYNPSELSKSIVVKQAQQTTALTLNIAPVKDLYYWNEMVTLSGQVTTLPDNNPADINVLEFYNDTTHLGTISNVVFGYYLIDYYVQPTPEQISAGEMKLRVVYEGSDDYESSEQLLTINVSPVTAPTGTITLNQTSYEQGEVVTISWSNVNFTNGHLSIYNPNSIDMKDWVINTESGTVYYTLATNAELGNWNVYLASEIAEIDSKSFDVTETPPEYCNQYFRIEDQNGNPLSGILSSVYWSEDVNVPSSGEIFVNVQKEISLIVTATVGEKFETSEFITCTSTPKVFIIEIEEPIECITHETQQECEDNGCYWWSDNTCQSAPEGTTETLDIYIKPYSWYEGKYEEALSKTLEQVTNLSGKIANYMISITGYEYKGIDILEDVDKNVIIIRIYLQETNETTLVAPIVIGGIVGIVVGILILAVGYIIGTSQSEYTKEEVIELIDDASDEAIEACKERYPDRLTDIDEAKAYADCVGGVDTTRVIATSDVVDEDATNAIDNIDNAIDNIGTGLDDGTILPEDIETIVNEKITIPTKTIVEEYLEKAKEEDCVFDIAGQCIISKKALDTMILIGLGLGGLFAISTVKSITKR